MSGYSANRVQHQNHATNALDACLWLWPFLKPEWKPEAMGQHSHENLESLSVAIFLGNTSGWITLCKVARRFVWISQQWCTACDAFEEGRRRDFAAWDGTLEQQICVHRMCRRCEVRIFTRLVEQDGMHE